MRPHHQLKQRQEPAPYWGAIHYQSAYSGCRRL